MAGDSFNWKGNPARVFAAIAKGRGAQLDETVVDRLAAYCDEKIDFEPSDTKVNRGGEYCGSHEYLLTESQLDALKRAQLFSARFGGSPTQVAEFAWLAISQDAIIKRQAELIEKMKPAYDEAVRHYEYHIDNDRVLPSSFCSVCEAVRKTRQEK